MILCTRFENEAGAAETVLEALLAAAPRVTLEGDRAWLDLRGLVPAAVHARVRMGLAAAGVAVRSGAASRPVVAAVAASQAERGEVVEVGAGEEQRFLAPLPLSLLGVEDPLLGWLADVGIGRCGELAAVTRESVEVRFGGGAVQWWRWSRGDDDRRLFVAVPPEQPHAGIDFVDYVVTDPERLIFATNALLGAVCAQMVARGSHARSLRLRLPLANGSVWARTLKTARPTAERAAWLRLARALLERLTVPDSVVGIALEVESTEAAAALQGDLFDAGFASVSAVASALGRVLEDHGDVVQEPSTNEHPLAELRGKFRPLELRETMASPAVPAADSNGVTRPGDALGADDAVGLTLQLLDEPRLVGVETARRRDHQVPVRYRDGRWHAVVTAAGPDRVSGGQWDAGYAREYFRAVTTDGRLVWLFRDAARNRWYLHGWWD
jgi:protein ImuB